MNPALRHLITSGRRYTATITPPPGPLQEGTDYTFAGTTDVPTPTYTWKPLAWVISGQGTASAVIRFPEVGYLPVTLTIGGGGSASASWWGAVYAKTVPMTSVTASPYAGTASDYTFNVPLLPAGTPVITWTAPGGTIVSQDDANRKATIRFDTEGSKTVSVSVTQGGLTATGSVTVTVQSVWPIPGVGPADVMIWYDANDRSSLTIRTDGSLEFVSSWGDKAQGTNVNDPANPYPATPALQATLGSQPRLVPNAINGKPALLGGASTFMQWSNIPYTGLIRRNFYVVAKFDTANAGANAQYSGFFGAGVTAQAWNHQINNPGNSSHIGIASNYNYCEFEAAGSPDDYRDGRVAVYSFCRDGGTWKAKWTHSNWVTHNLTGDDVTKPGVTNRLFRNQNNSGPWYIAELICFDINLTPEQETQLSDYFEAKWGTGVRI